MPRCPHLAPSDTADEHQQTKTRPAPHTAPHTETKDADEVLGTRPDCPGLFMCVACLQRPGDWVLATAETHEAGDATGAEEATGGGAESSAVRSGMDGRGGEGSYLAETADDVRARQAGVRRWREERPQEEVGHLLRMEYLCGNPDCPTGATEDAGLGSGEEDVPGNKLLKCSQCKSIRYCGKGCQQLHWKVHNNTCAAARSLRRFRRVYTCVTGSMCTLCVCMCDYHHHHRHHHHHTHTGTRCWLA